MAAWTLPNDGPLTDEQRRRAMENFDAYIRRHNLHHEDVARQVGKPGKTLIRDLTRGVFRDHADDHIRKLNNWTEQHARQQNAKVDGKFVKTDVALQILRAARLIRENQTMGMVVGPTGIGKSRCAEALRETFAGAILVPIVWGSYHPKGLTSAMAERLGVRSWTTNPQGVQYKTQLERVIGKLGDSGRMVIIDDAHKLRDEALELLREIHDRTGCPILLFATKDLQDRIQRGADPDGGQLYSRFDVIWPVTQGRDVRAGGKGLFTVDEIRKLYEQTPIKLSPDAARYLQDVANELGHGSLRRCRILLTNATRRARKRGGVDESATVTVTADDLAYADETLRPELGDKEAVKQRRAAASKSA